MIIVRELETIQHTPEEQDPLISQVEQKAQIVSSLATKAMHREEEPECPCQLDRCCTSTCKCCPVACAITCLVGSIAGCFLMPAADRCLALSICVFGTAAKCYAEKRK